MLPRCSHRLQNMNPKEQVLPLALAVPPPRVGGATTPWAAAMDPDANALPSVPAVTPPLVGGHGNTSLPPPLSPMVLWVLPLWGSSAPIGFIYDATPDPDGGLLADMQKSMRMAAQFGITQILLLANLILMSGLLSTFLKSASTATKKALNLEAASFVPIESRTHLVTNEGLQRRPLVIPLPIPPPLQG
jgi:hypothetical protein